MFSLSKGSSVNGAFSQPTPRYQPFTGSYYYSSPMTQSDSTLEKSTGIVADQKYADVLYNHKIYHFYKHLSEKHAALNKKCGDISESIWPNLTGDTLVGPEKIGLRSGSLYTIDDKFLTEFDDVDELQEGEHNSGYTFFHLGSRISGHPKIVHGGLLATLLDELTCRVAFQNFHSKKGVTANLNIKYLKPCFVNSYVLIKCTFVNKKGRKCITKGQVFKLDLDAEIDGDIGEYVESKENLLTEAECLVIEPKWVEELHDQAKQAVATQNGG